MNVPDYHDDAEVDLAELFATIWAYKFKVATVTLAAAVVAGFYVSVIATPQYEAKARFELLDSSASNPLGDLGGLAALAGITTGGGGGEADTLEDRILSRPFIDRIYDEAGLADDASFNPQLRTPSLTARIKQTITGVQSEPLERSAYIEAALGYFMEELSISVLPNGLIEVGLTHQDPERAAFITNIIVDAAIEDIHERARSTSREKLAYFAEQLGDVQSDLDSATRALSEYALNNDLRSQEDLARASTQLVALRQNADEIRDRQLGVAALKSIGAAEFNAREFAAQFPVSLDVEFRRALGWGINTASWTYPTPAIMQSASEQLQARLEAVERNIEQVQSQATLTGEAAIALSELQRNVQVQSAIYEAMIQQFEAQSFATGFESSSGRQIDPAVVPDKPASPRTKLFIILSTVLGCLAGVAIALVGGIRSGRCFTVRRIQETVADIKTIALPKIFAEPIKFPKSIDFQRKVANSVAVDQVIAAMPVGGTCVQLLPTSDGPAASALVLGIGQKMASIHGDVLALSFGSIAFDTTGFACSDQIIAGRTVWKIDADFDLCSVKELRLHEVEDCISAAKRSYKSLIIVTEPSMHGILQSLRVANLADAVAVVAQAGATTRDSLEAAIGVVKAEKPYHAIVAAV